MANESFQIKIENDKQVRDNLRRIAIDLHGKPIVDAMTKAVLIVERRAKKNAPVDTGRLRNSITHAIESSGGLNPHVRGIVGTNVKYAPYMEFGTGTFVGRPPHKVPVSAVEGWARRHGINPYLVAKAIMDRGGLEGHEYFGNAIKDSEREIRDILQTGVRLVLK